MYQMRSDGKVIALGIHSGGTANGGGSDHVADSSYPYRTFFTDIRQSRACLPSLSDLPQCRR